jgi:predicted nucleotidyltransferase
VVDAEQHAGATLYTLNREHLAYPAIDVLTRLRGELLDRITALLGSWHTRPEHASLFGSAARRDGDTSSDIDILLIRPEGTDEDDETWASQVEDLRERVRRWTGNHCQPFQADRRDLTEYLHTSAAIIGEWTTDSIRLLGPSIESYLSVLPPRGDDA